MSFFLLPQALIDSIVFPTYPSQSQSIIQQQSFQISPPIEKSILLPTTDALKVLPSSSACLSSQLKWMLVVGSISQEYKTLLNLSFSKVQNKLHLSLSILNKAQSFFKITNSARLVEILNKVNHYAATRPLNILTINIDARNNKINIQLPFLLLNNPFFKNHIKSIHTFCSRDLHSVLKFIVSCCSQMDSDVAHLQGESVNRLANLNKCSHILHVPMPYDDQVYLQKKGNNPFDRVVKNKVQIEECIRRTNLLLATAPFYTSQNYCLSQSQLRYIQQINHKNTYQLQRPQENTLNQIYLYNMPSIKLVKINEGGFCSIFQSEINYTPIDTAEPHSNRMGSKLECKKTVIFKKGDRNDGFSRNEHQLRILKTLANVHTPYLPKYYLITNKPNPFSNSLVMDYVSSKHLKDYLRLHSRYMSLKTKLTLIMGIIESLRFLERRCIVHLDLKPNNIMICPNLKVKLIDFGESYHHEVCSKGAHQPGYTIPYSPPQIFNNDPKDFTSKSDVFSLGVIMFQILYNTYPFDIFEDTSKIDDIMGCFLRKWFFCPQWAQTFGDVHIMRVMNMLICKCLSYDVGRRPEVDWLAFMIRECIQIVK